MSNQDYETDPDSVQVLYRPMVTLRRAGVVPAAPSPGDTHSESYLFWKEEFRRSMQGWTAADGKWMNPYEYFFFNHIEFDFVDESGREVISAPLWCDSDCEILSDLYLCACCEFRYSQLPADEPISSKKRARANRKRLNKELHHNISSTLTKAFSPGQDYIITKGRRKHWSYITHCGVFMWDFCVDRQGNVGIGYDCRDSREEGQRIFRNAYDRLHPFWQHAALDTDREGELAAAELVRQADGTFIKRTKNVIFFKEMDKRPGAFRGKRLKRILLDEAGKYLNLRKIMGVAAECLRIGTLKFGSLLIGGTTDAISNKSQDYKELWRSATALGWAKRFVPAWKVAPPDVDWFTGESLRHLAEPKYLAERERLRQANQMELYFFSIQENPLNESELFSAPTMSMYPGWKLMEQVSRILDFPGKMPMRGCLEWEMSGVKRTGEVTFVERPEGDWLVHPLGMPHKELEDMDVMGVDSVYKDDSPHSDSQCALVIYRRETHRLVDSDMPIATYVALPGIDLFNIELHKAMLFWGARVMLELTDQYIYKYLEDEKLTEQLIWLNHKPGVRPSDAIIATQTALTQRWIDVGGLERCWFEGIIDALKQWRQGNTDIGSAFHSALYGVDALREKAVLDEVGAAYERPFIQLGQVNWNVGIDLTGDGQESLVPVPFTQLRRMALFARIASATGSSRHR